MFRLPFGRKQLEEMLNRERYMLLGEGKKELEIASNEQEGSEVIRVPTKAYGYLLHQGATENFSDRQSDEGYLHRCERDGQTYECLTPSKVFPPSFW